MCACPCARLASLKRPLGRKLNNELSEMKQALENEVAGRVNWPAFRDSLLRTFVQRKSLAEEVKAKAEVAAQLSKLEEHTTNVEDQLAKAWQYFSSSIYLTN